MSMRQPLKQFRLTIRARALRRRCEALATVDDVVDEVLRSRKFSSAQKRAEIAEFVKLLAALKPRIICEIGTSAGGTLRLFCHFAPPDARILSIDIDYPPICQAAHRHFARRGQRITTLKADSHAPTTLAYVKQWLDGDQFDLLFIDGDHSHEGVASDFQLYSPLVRRGGLIGLHDIVPDFKTRYGRETAAGVGEVPRFWTELKKRFSSAREIIEHPDQDGYGIGVLEW